MVRMGFSGAILALSLSDSGCGGHSSISPSLFFLSLQHVAHGFSIINDELTVTVYSGV